MNRKQIVNGLVLMGGSSQRMGSDKAQLIYHQKPQYEYTYDLLSKQCTQVYLSTKQDLVFPFSTISDSEQFKNCGPIAGLCAAFEKHLTAWIVLAIDYPLFDANDLQKLVDERDENSIATVYYNSESEFFEPFLGIYEISSFDKIKKQLQLGKNSMQQLLQQEHVKKVVPLQSDHIRSVDFPEERIQLLNTLKK